MSLAKQAVLAVALGVLATITAGVVAFLNEVHLEISFDKLKDFRVTDLASYAALGTALKVELETASDQEFALYWVDRDDNGKRAVYQGKIIYKDFRLHSRISGKLIDDENAEYAVTGYYNSQRLVFSYRGDETGVGIFIVDAFQVDDIPHNVFAGYAIFEGGASGTANRQLLQCPFIMLDEQSTKKFNSAEEKFPFLLEECKPFTMPTSITVGQPAK